MIVTTDYQQPSRCKITLSQQITYCHLQIVKQLMNDTGTGPKDPIIAHG